VKLTSELLLDDERRMLLESVADYRKAVLDEAAREIDESPASGKVEEAWRKAGSIGLAASLVSEEGGGQGMDTRSFCLVLCEVARASAGFAALMLSHNLALWALERAGGGQDLKELGKGEGSAALAWPFRELGAGGQSVFVPGGSTARLIVFVSGSGELFTAEPGYASVSLEEVPYPMGLRAARPATFNVKNLSDLEASGRLSPELSGELEGRLLLGAAAISLGLARQAYDKAYAYASERYQAGDLIINHQQIRLMLAEILVGLEAGEAALKQAAESGGSGGPRVSACRAAKVFTADRAMAAALDAVQVHGGYGYMRDYGIERLMRDAKYCQQFPRPPQEETLAILKEME
jgi:alkylation response protein AidB-like acyl-CoA dehydrogenase